MKASSSAASKTIVLMDVTIDAYAAEKFMADKESN